MSDQIHLTEEQKKVFACYVKDWTKVAMSTEPINVEAAIDAARRAYEICGYTPPKRYAVFQSPKSAAYAAAIFKDHFNKQTPAWRNWIDNGVPILIQDDISSHLSNPALTQEAEQCINEMAFGCHEASWLVMYDFLIAEGNKECENIIPLIDLAKVCGWWSPYEEVCILQDRPCALCLDDQQRLHNDTGPALAYRDGVKLYCIHGVRIEENIVEHPETITVGRIEKEQNAEVRRILVGKFGRDRYLKESGAVLIHEDDFGKLWNKPQPGDEDLRVVEVINGTPEPDGTFKNYFLRVAPTVKTAREAVASTYKMREKDYRPTIRT